ncbi:MAG: beta-mannanase [Chthoniobacteraceae bacterium]|nr:beta-mannanase [Chthoniobacteraceae bacterium]
MNSRFTRAALALFLFFSLASCGRQPAPGLQAAIANPRLSVPAHGIYTGAYIDFGDKEESVTLEAIEKFERMVEKHQAIVASSSYWGEQTFPEANVRLISRHGSIPLIFWSPWDKPYVESRGIDKYSLTSIIAGEHDAYLDMWADKAREFGQPMIVSFANEMNGSWFPWSGVLYGGEKVVSIDPPVDGKPEVYHYQGPETFKKAWRHVVDRVRARGARNIQWVLHLMVYSDPQEGWNLAEEYYPGSEYVDWLGLSLYGSQFPGDKEWAPFFPLLDWPYTELTLIDPDKPIMLCEWGVAELPHLGSKADWFRDGLRLMKTPKFSRLKAIVYWHERWQNGKDDLADNAGKYSNLRVNSSPEALEAYRQEVADPFYLDRPILVPGPSLPATP